MKKILLAIGFFVALTTEAQVVNKFRDSSVFFKGVRFDSTLVFKGLKTGSTADTNVVVISSTGKASKVSKSAFLGDLPIYSISDSNTVINYDVLNSQNTPPVSPSTGDVYLVGNVPTDAWVGHAKDIAEWNGSAWVFTDGVQGDFLYNTTNALTYIFRSGNWVQTTGIPALNNGNTISSGLRIGTNNARSLTFETNNVNRGRFDSVGRFYVYDTSLRKSNKYLQIDSITGRLVASEISGGGGSSTLALDKISDALDTSTIDNANFKQEWQWNSLANNTGFKLSSTSGGLLNTQNRLFEVQMSGAMTGTGNSSYAGYFKNTQTNGSAFGLYAEGTSTAINAVGYINTSTAYYVNNDFGIFNSAAGSNIKAASSSRLNLRGDNLINFQNIAGTINYASINNITDNVRQSLLFNGVYVGGQFYCSATTSAMVERSSDKLIFSANSGLTASTPFTPNNIMTVYGTNSNVGIGTTTPVASAKLEVSSTTSGFLPPRMTATQASAISTPAQGLLLFVTDTDGTFTSVGWWGYNGSTWEKLNN